jgi:hypothetical protein
MATRGGAIISKAALPVRGQEFMRRVLDNRYLLVVAVLLLQFSVGEPLYAAVLPSQPADVTMAAMHNHGCAGDACPAGDCQPQQCNMGASSGCHCSCAQIPSLAASESTFVTSLAAAARASEIPGSAAPGRPENPFRPPA